MTNRVQIPAYTDAWMKGDRYGEVIRTFRKTARNKLGQITAEKIEYVLVKLDKSGKQACVLLSDCNPVN